jgi:hypothetical protein
MDREIDYVLEGLTEQELKDTIIKNVSEINRVKEDAKMYAKGAREAIKSLDDRITDCLELIALKRTERAA